jgi:thiamine-monophosphate kinase
LSSEALAKDDFLRMTDRSPATTVGQAGESALIDRIRRRTGAAAPWITIGIGDDAAAIAPDRNRQIIVTTDSLVEDVHFRRAWTAPRAIGHKALAVNLSDLAAMGATPRACLLSLVMPEALPLDEFDELIDGLASLAAASGAPLAGGNLTRSPGPLVIDVTAVGSAHPRRTLTRGGGRPGDLLFVSGRLGGAAAGLGMLEAGERRDALDDSERRCLERFEMPAPRLRLGHVAAFSRAVTACIDLSDGLADAVRQIAAASGTGADVEAGSLPIEEGSVRWANRSGRDGLMSALAGGEDYELLFAVSPRRRRSFLAAARRCPDVPVTHIGQLTQDGEPALVSAAGRLPLPAGFRHF